MGEFLVEREAYIGEMRVKNGELEVENGELRKELEGVRQEREKEREGRVEAEREVEKWKEWYQVMEEQQALALE